MDLNKERKNEIENIKKLSKDKETNLLNDISKQEKDLLQNQKAELDELHNLEIKIKPKISPFFLQMKAKEYFLSKQERYIEADEARNKANEIYMNDNKNIDDKKKLIYLKKYEELILKHGKEHWKFDKKKEKEMYMLKEEEDKKIQLINNKYNEINQKIKLEKTIEDIKNKNNKRKKKNNSKDFKRYKNNPWN